MPLLARFVKSPMETIDYDIDFNPWLAERDDTAEAFGIGYDEGINIVSSELIGGVVRIFVSGGTVSTAYIIAADIATAGGRVKRGEIEIRVQGDVIPSYIDSSDEDEFVDANDG